MAKTTAQILTDAVETLRTAECGLRDMRTGTPDRRLPGLRNVIVFGRAVTNVLQNLRSIEPNFDNWYAPFQEQMRKDPLLRYFYESRSEILKEGRLRTATQAHVTQFGPEEFARLGPPPPGARNFFIGDQAGGSGWEIVLHDGEIFKYYVDMPEDVARSEIHLADPPREHLGVSIDQKDAIHHASLYLQYLARLVRAARTQFSAGSSRS